MFREHSPGAGPRSGEIKCLDIIEIMYKRRVNGRRNELRFNIENR